MRDLLALEKWNLKFLYLIISIYFLGIHNSITHRDANNKKAIKASWKAPEDYEGVVTFKYSIGKSNF